MPAPLPAVDWLAAITTDSGTLADAARAAGADAEVPSCPGWAVTELLEHIGSVLYRASLIIGERRERRPHRSETTAPPGDPFGWYEQGRAAIIPALRDADPDASYVTFLGPKPLAWWLRRLANETCVHRVDAEQAAGSPVVVDVGSAADGVDEKLETYLPVIARQHSLARPVTVTLHADDIGAAWTATIGDDSAVTVVRDANDAVVDATVTAGAAALYLWFWARAPEAAVRIEGDLASVAALRAAASV